LNLENKLHQDEQKLVAIPTNNPSVTPFAIPHLKPSAKPVTIPPENSGTIHHFMERMIITLLRTIGNLQQIDKRRC
jgi:hypothetical protein